MSGRVSRRASDRVSGGGTGEVTEDDESRKIETNVWLVGDDDEIIVVDAAFDAGTILDAVGDRHVLAVVCTHAHESHSGVAAEVAARDEAPVALHPADGIIWDTIHGGEAPEINMADGGIFEVADTELQVLHTPGHTPGGVCLYAEELAVVLSGDTLLASGPGPTDRRHADFPTLLTSIGEKLLTLPDDTRVLCGHDEETTVGAQDGRFDTWVSRGP
ncbi:MAG: MBL fold metallo-hydrolase [Streptosporangiaceae bacterium]